VLALAVGAVGLVLDVLAQHRGIRRHRLERVDDHRQLLVVDLDQVDRLPKSQTWWAGRQERPEPLAELARRLRIQWIANRIVLDGEDVTEAIRSSEVTAATRYAADNPEVRAHLVAIQRAVASGRNVVVEGRDQGTVVFPHAECKIFLTASPVERARRRVRDLEAQGEPVAFDKVLASIQRRDHDDSIRPVGPLARAPDAIEVPTDGLSVEEIVDRLVSMVAARR
jgi:cytidylate kinase